MTCDDQLVEESALTLAQELAGDAIDLAASAPSGVVRKADALDLVTAADRAIEEHFRRRIGEKFPGHGVLGEEQGLDEPGRDWTWIVDPIDGTYNYATGFVGAGSAIALMRGGALRVGAIADLALGTVLSCRRGAGVIWSGGTVPDLDADAPGRSRLFVDPGHQVPHPVLFAVVQKLAAYAPVVPRMVGSAAVSLASVALAGGCFVGAGLDIWDAAAGMLLAEERGLAVRWWGYEGDTFHHVLAGEPELVSAYEPLMPDYVEAWRMRTAVRGDLLGPSDTILLG